MITDTLVRKQFAKQTLEGGVKLLYEAWKPAVSAFQVRSGQLMNFAQSGAVVSESGNGYYELRLLIPLHLRFLDIQYRNGKSKGSKASAKSNLYNKLVWPILYNKVFPEIKYGFTDEVKTQLTNELKEAVKE